jgi:tetratricopeptide (TPR) repeat protein
MEFFLKKFLISILLFLVYHSIVFAQTNQELFEKGVVNFKQGHYQEAVDQFTELINRSPEHADAYKNRGVSYMKLEKFDQAISDFETAKAIFPELKDLYSNLGVAWYYKKNCKKAIENYNIAIEMSPTNAVAYFNRALCLVELDKIKQAHADLDQTLAITPDFYWAICFKADLLASDGKPIQAIEMYEQALQIDPGNPYPSEKIAELRKSFDQEKNNTRFDKAQIPQKKEARSSLAVPAQKKHDHGYALQVGAFQNPSNAYKMTKKLSEKGFDSRVLELTGKNEATWYIVRVGRYSTKSDAEKTRIELKKKMKLPAIVRPAGRW